MDIKEIAKTMTREEFISHIEGKEWAKWVYDYSHSCPASIGLTNAKDNKNSCNNCHQCWLNSIKEVKFKGEDEVKEKTYKNSEALAMLEKNSKLKFTCGTFKLYVAGNHIIVENWSSTNNGFCLDDKWALVQEPVSFMDAVKSGKRVRVEHEYIENQENKHYKNFQNLWELFSKLVQDFCSEGIQDIVLNGTWYVEG